MEPSLFLITPPDLATTPLDRTRSLRTLVAPATMLLATGRFLATSPASPIMLLATRRSITTQKATATVPLAMEPYLIQLVMTIQPSVLLPELISPPAAATWLSGVLPVP